MGDPDPDAEGYLFTQLLLFPPTFILIFLGLYFGEVEANLYQSLFGALMLGGLCSLIILPAIVIIIIGGLFVVAVGIVEFWHFLGGL